MRSSISAWIVLSVTALVLAAGSPSAPSPSLARALATVDSLRTHRQFETALTRLDSLNRTHPNRASVQWRRALLLTDLGKGAEDEQRAVALYREAERRAEAALRCDSTNAWAHLSAALAAGRLTLHVGRAERVAQSRAVKRHADRAIALDSTLAGAYHLRGRWHREVADLNFITRALVKGLYGGLPDASFEQAIRDFKRAIALESKPYNHLELAKTYLKLNRTDDARAQLHRALETAGSPFDREHKQEAGVLLTRLRR
jgi:tetratricopeptide (TPR) repeat protein